MTSRPPLDRPQGEVVVDRPIPEHKPEDGALGHGWVWDDVTGQIIGYEGINPTEDTLKVSFRVGALTEEFIIPPGTKERIRFDLPQSRRLACRRATVADHPWQQAAGWIMPGVDSIHTERIYGTPVRNSPSVASVAVTEFFGGATTTHNVPMPATVDAGDLLLVGWFHDNASLTQASGFAPLSTATNTDRCYIFGRVAVGDEDSTNVNFQALTASFAVAHTYRISAGTWAGVLSGVMVTAATGTSATPDPPNNAPHLGSDDYLWLVFCGKIQASVTGAPTNYTNFTGDSSDLSGSARRSTTASSENPGTFSGSSSFAWMAFTIAIASDDIDLGDIPVFVSVGNTAAGTAGVTAALPGGIVTGDKLLLHIQGEGEDANADPANADWTLVDTQASATGGAAGDTRLTVYEVDYDSSDPPSLSIGDAGDHIICFITAWRDPNGGTLDVHVLQGTTDATADTSLSATGVTTTEDNCLIVVSVGLGDDSGVLAWVNASLAAPPITPAGSDRTTQGSDGSVDVAFGGLAGQGASGTTTGTLATSEEEANIVLALVPVAGGPTPVTGDLDATEGADVFDGSGTATPPAFTGTMAGVEAGDIADFTGTAVPPAFTGDLAAIEGPDVMDATGTHEPPPVDGDIAAVEAGDIFEATGTHVPPPVTGSMAALEGGDVFDAAGTAVPPPITGDMAGLEGADVMSASGTAILPSFTGTIDATEGADVFDASGAVVPPSFTGVLAGIEGPDVMAADGLVSVAEITGTLAVLELGDAMVATGITYSIIVPGGKVTGARGPSQMRGAPGAASSVGSQGLASVVPAREEDGSPSVGGGAGVPSTGP